MADGVDQTGLLRERHELGRADRPAHGMVPAQQRLEADHPTRVQLDERLVVEIELVGVEGALEVGLQLQPGQRGGVHLRLEQLVAVAALLLRLVHRHVRVAQQLTGGLARSPEDDADARLGQHLGAAQCERRRDRVEDPRRHSSRALDAVRLLEHERELVAAEARRRVRAA